ncbi:MAG: SlyX family protein [Kiritimatiellae bacterium]|nr:SlyX family protein [Kiritimatiellia bacterium]MBR5622699.1 SlyX family protein [Opitutales bacterium]
MSEETNYAERLRELEMKITFLEDYVAKQNEVIVDQGRQLDRLLKALRQLAEKAESFGSGDSMPANEKPPHW